MISWPVMMGYPGMWNFAAVMQDGTAYDFSSRR
jgi:hypothetical protein